jgi:hypothetical protein
MIGGVNAGGYDPAHRTADHSQPEEPGHRFNFDDSADLLLREAHGFLIGGPLRLGGFVLMRQSQPHGKLVLYRRTWPAGMDLCLLHARKDQRRGFGGAEIAEREIMGASHYVREGGSSGFLVVSRGLPSIWQVTFGRTSAIPNYRAWSPSARVRLCRFREATSGSAERPPIWCCNGA